MGKRIGGSNISIAQLRDGYSYTEVRLYSEVERSSYPLTLLYNFTSGTLLSGVDGKTLAECLNGWSQEPGTGRFCTIASARTTGEIAEIATSSWCEQFITSEDGETVTTVTLYTRASSSPSLPTGTLEYDFSTGAITGSGKGEWVTSMEDFTGGTAYALWSTSAIAVMNKNGKGSIEASKWSTPKKIAENGVSPVEMYLGRYSYIFPATEDGIIAESDYLAFSSDVLLVQGGKSIDFSLSVISSGITYAITEGKTVKLTEDSVMLGDTASIKVIATYDGGSISKSISLAKAKAGKDVILYFAWSKSEDEFIPKNSEFFMWGNVFNFFNGGMTGSFPLARWTSNREKLEKLKDNIYCYLWAKLTEDGTPFLFTGKRGLDGLTGACTLYQYYASTSSTEQTGGEWLDEMPSIAGGKFLWMRTKFVPAGGNAEDYKWGTPVIAGSDISLLMANIEEIDKKVEQNTTAITINSEAIATKVSQDTFNELGERVTTAETRIEQSAEAIELRATTEEVESAIKVTEGKIALMVDGTDVKTSAGIVVGVVDGEGYVKIDAPNIIAEGTITAEQLRADCISGKTFIVKNGGVIRSETLNDTTGFSLSADGKFSAFNAYLNGILDTPVLQTQNENVEGTQIDVRAMDEQDYYLGSQAKTKVKEAIGKNVIKYYSGTYAGVKFSQVINYASEEDVGYWTNHKYQSTYITSIDSGYSVTIGPFNSILRWTSSSLEYTSISSITSWNTMATAFTNDDVIYGISWIYYLAFSLTQNKVMYHVTSDKGWQSVATTAFSDSVEFVNCSKASYLIGKSSNGTNWDVYLFDMALNVIYIPYLQALVCSKSTSTNPITSKPFCTNGAYYAKNDSTWYKHKITFSDKKWSVESRIEITVPDGTEEVWLSNGLFFARTSTHIYYTTDSTPTTSSTWTNMWRIGSYSYKILCGSQNWVMWNGSVLDHFYKNSIDLADTSIRSSGFQLINYVYGDAIYYLTNSSSSSGERKALYRIDYLEMPYQEGLNFLNASRDVLAYESDMGDYPQSQECTLYDDETALLSLPSSIPEGMDFYRKIPELSTEEKDYISINKANVPAFTYWDTNLNADVTLDAVTTAKIVQISKTQWLFDNIIVLSSSWFFKNITSLDAYFVPNSKSIGAYTKDINPIDEDTECSIGNITPYKFVIAKNVGATTVEATTVEAEEKISAPTLEATTEVTVPSLKVGANSKVIIGEDEESGYIDIYNVDQGENAVHWHIDVAGNVLRFVLNNATEVSKIDENGVYGAVFN